MPILLKNLTSDDLHARLAHIGVTPRLARLLQRSAVQHNAWPVPVANGFSAKLLAQVQALVTIPRLTLLEKVISPQDGFAKYLFRGNNADTFEAVRIPLLHRPGDHKYVVCVSSQAGCALGCAFCATGRLGFRRDLAAWEIVEQVRHIQADSSHPVRGVVFMGMGEPLLNYETVMTAARIMSEPCGLAIAAKSITISTAGIVPGIRRFTAERQPYRLVVSLTSADPEVRRTLMPIEQTHPTSALLDTLRAYHAATGQRVTLAWIMLAGINTRAADAVQLAQLTQGLPIKLDLIDVNDPRGKFQPPSDAERNAFRDALRQHLVAPVARRYSGGSDIHAACGMLATSHPVRPEVDDFNFPYSVDSGNSVPAYSPTRQRSRTTPMTKPCDGKSLAFFPNLGNNAPRVFQALENAESRRQLMWQGAYTAIVTPFNRNGAVDYGKLRALIEEQIVARIDGLVPVGTTGESPTVDFDEHHKLIEVCIETAGKRCKIIAGTGANSTHEALELTRHAMEAGADASLQVTPYYNRPSQTGLIRHFSAIADLGLPVMLYNIPGRTGREIELNTLVELAKHPKIVAVKEAGGSVDRVSQILQRCQIEVLSGDDALTLPMMAVGAVGVVSVVSNVAPKAVADMVHAALRGDWPAAQALHKKYYRLFTDLFLDTNPVPVKAALAMQGKIEETYRLPLCEMAAAPRAKLAETLKTLGLV